MAAKASVYLDRRISGGVLTLFAGDESGGTTGVELKSQRKGDGGYTGLTAASGVSCTVEGVGNFLTLVLTLTNFSISLSNVGSAVEFGGAKLLDFPSMAFLHMSSVCNFTATRVGTNLSATFNPTFSLGSTITADNSLATTEVDMVAATAAGAATAGVATFKKGSSAAQLALFGGTTSPSTAVDVNINVTVPDADVGGADSMLLNGTVVMNLIRIGTL